MRLKWPDYSKPPTKLSNEILQHILYELGGNPENYMGEDYIDETDHTRMQCAQANLDRHLHALGEEATQIREANKDGRNFVATSITKDDKGILLFGYDTSLVAAYLCLRHDYRLVSDGYSFVFPKNGKYNVTLGKKSRPAEFTSFVKELADTDRNAQNVMILTYRPDSYQMSSPVTHAVYLNVPEKYTAHKGGTLTEDLTRITVPDLFFLQERGMYSEPGSEELIEKLFTEIQFPFHCAFDEILWRRAVSVHERVMESRT